ncbi:hypothetical protein AEA09_12220 [Lysinibacillus contaminans]|uniref:SLH domain-containing protein n=1 Tax=Lysinibacillus contaminans TaxID=1293441 RepID=A0ABR5K3E1_9BACI|nr:S-layer homology domain-containing protein [Lysinibacillus contaminans]KOS69241.1 hypothetical protein AEA09_12220 [Lysinibacillus contaminans]
MKNRHSKWVVSAASAALVASAVVPVASAASFSDISDNDHQIAILALAEAGIVGGYPDGTFKPNAVVTRGGVTKFLGKWLEANGYEIPKDFDKQARFTDLPTTSKDKELLQYAALVKDEGVFKGANNKLMQTDNMSREQMAVVLVRAIKTVYDLDLVAQYKEKTYETVITDLDKASTDENREAIIALEYAKITNVKKFNPKNTLTRGQFASFLHRTITDAQAPEPPIQPEVPLLIQTVTVTNETTLQVTLTDGTQHTVTLPTPLPENEETKVDFVINEKQYEAVVTYEVAELKVKSIDAINGTQVKVAFNQAIDPSSVLKADSTIADNVFAFSNLDTLKALPVFKIEISEDKKAITFIFKETLKGTHRYVLQNVKSAKGMIVSKIDNTMMIAEDTTAPFIKDTKQGNASTVTVQFSEPMLAFANEQIQAALPNGVRVVGIKGALAAHASEATFDLSSATANGQQLSPGAEVQLTFIAARDVAGNLISPNPSMVTVKKGDKDGIAPTLTSVHQTGPNTFQLLFSEELLAIAPIDLAVTLGSRPVAVTKIEKDATNGRLFNVTVDANVSLLGVATIATGYQRVVTDLSGEVATFSTDYNFVKDDKAPTLVNSEVVYDQNVEYLQLTFDKAIKLSGYPIATFTGSYIHQNILYNMANVPGSEVLAVKDSPTKVRLKLSSLLNQYDIKGANYDGTLTFSGVASTYGVNLKQIPNVKFTRAGDLNVNINKLALVGIRTTANDLSLTDTNVIYLHFNYPVDPALAKNVENYVIDGAQVESAVIEATNLNGIKLTLKQDSNTFTGERNITIKGLKATNSTEMLAELKTTISLKENIAPKVASAYVTNNSTITLVFTEDVSTIFPTDFEVMIDGATVATATYGTDSKTALITITQSGKWLRAGSIVKIQKSTTNAIKDSSGNKLDLVPQDIYVPSNIQ